MSEPQHEHRPGGGPADQPTSDERRPEDEREDRPTSTTDDSTEDTHVIETQAPAAGQPASADAAAQPADAYAAAQPTTEHSIPEQPRGENPPTSAFPAREELGDDSPTSASAAPHQPIASSLAERDEVPAPARPTGPHLPAILLGLACLVIAGLALAQELGHLQVDWGDVGPLGIVAAGAVLVLLGLVGLLTSRRRES